MNNTSDTPCKFCKSYRHKKYVLAKSVYYKWSFGSDELSSIDTTTYCRIECECGEKWHKTEFCSEEVHDDIPF